MKNFTLPLLTFVLSFTLSYTNAQCPPDEVMLNSQAAVSAFVADYPNCTEINGNLQIGIISSLSANTNITNVSYLENINSISGNLLIVGNNDLTSIEGLDQLTHVGGNVRIDYNEDLTDLNGLSSLETIGGSLLIGNNESLITVDGMQELVSVGGDATISENDILSEINGFGKLTTIGGYLSIWMNPMLSNIDEFKKLGAIGGNLLIDRNTTLENLRGLETLATLGGDFSITSNESLVEIGDLSPMIQSSSMLRIAANPNLSDCSIQAFCNHISNEGDVEIVANGVGCSSVVEIENSCGMTLPVELTGFRAEVRNASVVLTWQTLTENNNEGFEIERSNDAINWQSLGWEEGKGNTTTTQTYTFTDKRPMLGKSYYRLSQTDFDGKIEHSQALNVSFYNDIVSVYPNPVSEILKITVEDNMPIENIVVYNTSGREVLRETSVADSLNVTQLNSGTYIIAIQVDGETIHQKLVVE